MTEVTRKQLVEKTQNKHLAVALKRTARCLLLLFKKLHINIHIIIIITNCIISKHFNMN